MHAVTKERMSIEEIKTVATDRSTEILLRGQQRKETACWRAVGGRQSKYFVCMETLYAHGNDPALCEKEGTAALPSS